MRLRRFWPVRLGGLATATVAAAAWALPAAADEAAPPVRFNDFGATGLMQMPTGRMAPDGEFAFGASRVAPYRRLWVTVQGLPWLQGTLRYTEIEDRPWKPDPTANYLDKSFDIKLRLLEEGPVWPEVSLGLRDFGGTGQFSSEYIAATRRYYNWDFTLGMAWGNLGSRGHLPNPLRVVSERFARRGGSGGPTGGQIRNEFFTGETVGLFAGVEWRTPVEGLTLMLEYDSNNYLSEPAGEPILVDLPFNAGLSYRPFQWLDVGLAVERGNQVMLRTTLRSNLSRERGLPNVGEPPPVPVPKPPPTPPEAGRPAPSGEAARDAKRRLAAAAADLDLDLAAVDLVPPTATLVVAGRGGAPDLPRGEAADLSALMDNFARLAPRETEAVVVTAADGAVLDRRELAVAAPVTDDVPEAVFELLRGQGFTPGRFGIAGTDAYVLYQQGRYRNGMKAAVRAARAVAAVAPAWVRHIHAVETRRGLPVRSVRFLRRDVTRAAQGEISAEEALATTERTAPAMPAGVDWHEGEGHPRFNWSLEPRLREIVGNPGQFVHYQVIGNASASLEPWPGMAVAGALGVDLVNNFDDMSMPPDSRLPHVRTDLEKYIKDHPAWIESLHASQVLPLGRDWYGSAYAGLFERMFGGVGGELLYAPEGRRWALGLDLNHVWQREYDGGFGFRDYDVSTGHLTYYHDLPWYGLDVRVSAGRYLAGDVGATLELSREFDSGIRVGVWATKTDVSAEVFGEGGFDKGLYISIPFELFTTTPTTSRGLFAYRPLTRDGGQKVGRPLGLYNFVRGGDWNPLDADWGLR